MNLLGVCLFSILISISASSASGGGADHFRMHADRIWYRAEREPIQEFLSRFSDIGVAVAYDPSIEMDVAADVEGEKLEQALDRILTPLGYVATWDVIRGPVVDLLRLSSLKVFKPGNPNAARPYHGTADRRRVVSFDGRDFMADELLIGFNSGTMRREVEILLAQIGGTITDSIESMGVYRIRFSPGVNIPALVDQLRKNPLVATSEPNYSAALPNIDINTSDYLKINYNTIAFHPEGRALLAVLDSGLNPNILPSSLVVDSFDAIEPDRAPSDDVGHGTHMALIASGMVHPNGIAGSMQETGVPLVAVRTFDRDGITSNYDLMRGIEYALSSGAKVINLSWGSEVSSEFVATSISHAQSAGAIVVAAAGNEPNGMNTYPAAYPGVIAVAASDSNGKIWEKSNYGDFIFAAAPGLATLPDPESGAAGRYGGTSISSALTAGAIARYYAENPDATKDEVIKRLKSSLSPLGQEDAKVGGGILDTLAIERFLGDN